ncbi:MAG: glycosyltransferase [Alphaproteobacteria bacterium]
MKISLIIPVYNALEDVKKCLNSICENYNKSYEFIIVDDSSDNITSDYLKNFAKENNFVKLYRNKENLGFVKTCNFAINKAKGDIVVLLNSDTIIPSMFAEKIIDAFNKNEKAGIACPIPSSSGHFSLEMPKNFTVEKMNKLINKRHTQYPKLPSCNGFCFCIKREVINSIGYLDEIYGKGYGEEIDYSYKAIVNKFDCILIDNLYVFHKRHASFGNQRDKLSLKGSEILREHWGDFSEEWIKENKYVNPVSKIEKKIFISRKTFLTKIKKENGRRIIYLFGIKILSYKKKVKPKKYIPLIKKEGKRWLEIGPGNERIEGFEGLNIVKNNATDYIADVAKDGIPFINESFDLVYSSHFLEHIEWYKTKDVIIEMYRVLKKGGHVEIHVPDGLKIAKAFVDAEMKNSKDFHKDNWWKFNDDKDPCIWASGKTFTYGDGNVIKGHWNSHLAMFSYRYLEKLLKEIGFKNIKKLDKPRGHNHGWINLGISGEK